MCWLIEVCRNDALRVHLLNHCTIVAGSWFNLTQFPFLTNSTSFTIVIALLWNGWTLFISVSVIHSWESLFHSKHKWQGLHVFLVPDVTHLYHTHTFRPVDSAGSVKVHSGYVHFHFFVIMSFLCLWLLPDRALGLFISECIINNLHVISFVLIIFVWWNVFLRGEYWGYLPHLEAHGVPCRVCYLTLCD